MAHDYAGAVRAGTMEAGRLHRQLGLREAQESSGGAIDVFGAISRLELPLMLRPLKGLLGAYLSNPCPGIMVTTERQMSIQRLTAAHELGHCRMSHQPSLDDEENILRRAPSSTDTSPGFQETEAEAFAVAFMMPKWLITSHCARQGWHTSDLSKASVVYQLSLRLGASYEATCRTLERYRLISGNTRQALLAVQPRPLKVDLLKDYRPANYRGDVWLLTERDEGVRIDGSRNDLFVLRLSERSGGGYVWDFEQLQASGFVIVGDTRETIDPEGIGGPVIRRVTAAPQDGPRGRLQAEERRPWEQNPITTISVEFDLTGPEELGYSRAERRQMLEAA